MPEKYVGLSRESLEDAMLRHMAAISDLRKSSKQHRSRLADIRSEMAELTQELAVIEDRLKHIMQFPTARPAPVQVEQPDHQGIRLVKKRA